MSFDLFRRHRVRTSTVCPQTIDRPGADRSAFGHALGRTAPGPLRRPRAAGRGSRAGRAGRAGRRAEPRGVRRGRRSPPGCTRSVGARVLARRRRARRPRRPAACGPATAGACSTPTGQEWVVVTGRRTSALRGLADAGRVAGRPGRSPPGSGSGQRCAAWRRTGPRCVLHRVDGSRSAGLLGRVGRDFVEVLVARATGRRAAVTSRCCRSRRWRRCGPGEPAQLADVAGLDRVLGLASDSAYMRGDVLLQLDRLDAVLLAAADLDVAQLAGLHERPDLGDGGGQDLGDVGQRQEPAAGTRPACWTCSHYASVCRRFGKQAHVSLWTAFLPVDERGAEPGRSEHDVSHASTGSQHRRPFARGHRTRLTGRGARRAPALAGPAAGRRGRPRGGLRAARGPAARRRRRHGRGLGRPARR